MEEIWKSIEGYEGRYEVSNLGEVRSLGFVRVMRFGTGFMKGRVLRKNTNKPGYYQVFLCDDVGKVNVHRVHRLVASAFVAKVAGKEAVNHINGVRTDNRAENLEWVDLKENSQHSLKVLGKSITQYERISVKIGKDGKFEDCYSLADAARVIGCGQPSIILALQKGRNCKGYTITRINNIENVPTN